MLQEGQLLADTQTNVHWFVGDRHHVRIHCHRHRHVAAGGIAGSGGASASAHPVIAGTVLHANGGPAPAVSVRAFDKMLRHEVQIGAATTGADGAYAIPYDTAALPDSSGHLAELVVRVYRPDGSVWGESAVPPGSASPVTVDIIVDGTRYVGFSEFERVAQSVAPALDGVAPKDLAPADVQFLARLCALPVPAVQAFADSARLSDALGISHGILYGLLREGEPSDATKLAAVPVANLQSAADAALQANVMPAALAAEVAAAVATITKGAAAGALGDATSPAPGSLGPLLSISGASRALQEQVLTAFAQSTSSVPDRWTQLQASNDPNQIAAVQLALQLGAVVRNAAPLVERMSSLVSSGQVKSLRDLTKLTRYDWYGMLAGATPPPDVPGSTPEERRWNLAVTIERTVEDADPMGVLAARLAATVSSTPPAGGAVQFFASSSNLAETKDLVQFFANSPDFVVDQHNVDKYLANNPGAVAGVADVPRLATSLKRWQRVAKVTPRVNEMQALVAAGYASALAIVRAGMPGFSAAMAGTLDAQRADIVFGNASQVAAAALMVHARYNPTLNTPRPAGFEAWDPQLLGQAFAQNGLPDYSTLFGSVDFCACDECRSVVGPAAYLVDLLQFLGSGFAQLDAMRPDIRQIQLSCVNTNTPLPYIDLVDELLENAVASPPPPPSPPPAPALPPAVWPNTGWTADELLASPEYVNPNAYQVLGSATFPWTLPFDRSTEEANVYLKHLGVARADLLETFASPTSSATTAAMVRLDMTAIEWAVVTAGLSEVAAVRAASTGALALSGLQTVDGVVLGPNDRVLVKDQPNAGDDGVYVAASGPWTRSPDAATMAAGLVVPVQDGTTNKGSAWVLMSTGTPSTPAYTFAQLTPGAVDLSGQTGFWGPLGAPSTNVAVFLQQTGLSYDDLLDALWSDYVNPHTAVTVTFPTGDCALADATLSGATPDFFARVHRFTRLRRRLGWTAFQLDAAIRALAPPDLTADLLIKLSDVEALRSALGADLVPLLACWGRIDAKRMRDGSASLYESTFQNKTVLDDVARATFAFDATTGDVATAGTETWESHVPAICAALGISSDDFALMTDATAAQAVAVAPQLDGGDASQASLSLVNLTRLYRVVTLARALKLSVRELLALRALTGVDPFGGPSAARRLLACLTQIRASKFKLEELDELLRAVAPPGATSFITQDTALVLLVKLQAGLVKIQQENTLVPDPTGDVTRTALAKALSPDQAPAIDTLVAIIGGSSALTSTAGEQKSALEAALDPILDPLFGTGYVKSTIEPVLFASGGTPPSVAARFQAVLQALLPYLQKTQSVSLVTTTLAAQFRLEAGSMAALVGQALTSPGAATPAIGDFLDPSFVGAPTITAAPSDPVFQKLYKTLLLISKASFFVPRFGLTYDELTFVLVPDTVPLVSGSDARVGWVPLNALPLDAPPSPVTSPHFAAWSREAEVFAFRDRFGVPGAGMLSQLFAIAADATKTASDLTGALSAMTGWASADVTALVGDLELAYPADLILGETYGRLTRCMDALARLGVSADRAFPWASLPALTAANAADIKTAAKAKHDPASWSDVARPLADVLRSAQRDALVAWLVGNKSYADANALFDALLIDTQMCPCMLTSRIKQAIGSTQLFIQRALMGDPRIGVTLTPEQADQWRSYQGRYRLWQANREVFLYPENWLDPTLRDDKTPFFVDFENELNQGAITSDSAEEAFRHYLEDLQDVSRLAVVALCNDEAEQTVHVLARTQDQAPRYYYRTRVGTPYAYWTPWEKVPVQITGDHIVIVVWNRRVHVLWALFTERAQNDRPSTMPDPRTSAVGFPDTYYEIQLAFSEYKQGKWTAKQTTVATVTTAIGMTMNEHSLKTRIELDDRGGETLVVLVRTPDYTTDDPVVAGYSNQGFRFPSYGGQAVTFSEANTHDAYPAPLTPAAQWLEGKAAGPLPLETPLVGTTNVFQATMTDYQLAMPRQADDYDADQPFFFQDLSRVFFGWGSEFLSPWWMPASVDPSVVGRVVAQVPYVVSPMPALPSAPATVDAPARNTISSVGEMLVLPPTVARATALAISDPYRAPRRMVTGRAASAATKPVSSWNVSAAPTYAWPLGAPNVQFQFWTFYHPYVPDCLARLNRFGIDGLLNWDTQRQAKPSALLPVQLLDETNTGTYRFAAQFKPSSSVEQPYPEEDFDFSDDGAYAQYNWEVFFHGPLLIATKLSQNQRFDEAQRWFHTIFNPTDRETDLGSGNAHFWKVKKFFDDAQTTPVPASVTALLTLLAEGASGPDVDALHRQIAAYRQDPFNPWAIARIRTVALQKATVLKYIDNLIAWGDNLFRQNTIESINEATLMYVLASEILGPRPNIIPPPATPEDTATYASLLSGTLDELSNELVTLENYIPTGLTNYAPSPVGEPPQMLFFCVPPNDQLLAYWDTVADRLFKIRNCMNIEGQVQQLPLFEPPINPALLVRAAAAGLDLGSVLSDSAAPLVPYRFQPLAQKAGELVAEVRGLGQALLAAMEKRDAEALSLLRAQQELDVLTLVRAVKEKAVTEAQAALDGLNKSQGIAKQRQQYYDGLIAAGLLPGEQQSIDMLSAAHDLQEAAQFTDFGGAVLSLIPVAGVGVAGFGGTPAVSANYGGTNLVNAARATSAALSGVAGMRTYEANKATTDASHQRRAQEWAFQSKTAALDVDQIASQITAATIRLDIATTELTNHDVQIQNATDVRDFLRDKFTNSDLYDWMVGQISATYFQCYQLAYDLAKRAERAYRYEVRDESLGNDPAGFIRFGYWDSLKQGLLAGESLYYDLKRMEAAYLEKNRRELEVTKPISLAQIDPVALVTLRTTGVCFVTLKEALFDADYPGHYMRRIKAVAITIPVEVDRYVNVNCTLTLVRHQIRLSPDPNATAAFEDTIAAIESIVTSSGDNDPGLFDANLRDERYLPFEGAGAISLWKIELPADTNAFDMSTLIDVIVHLRYTARDGGDPLRAAARANIGLGSAPTPAAVPALPTVEKPVALVRLFSAKEDFSDTFFQFLNPDPTTTGQAMAVDLSDGRYPYHDPARSIVLSRVRFFFLVTDPVTKSPKDLKATLLGPGNVSIAAGATTDPDVPPLISLSFFPGAGATGTWTLQVAETDIPAAIAISADGHTRIDPSALVDVTVLCEYSLQ